MYARVTNIRFAPTMSREVVRVAQGFAPILKEQRGFNSLNVLTDSEVGGHHRLYVGDRSRCGGQRGQPLLHQSDEYDVQLPLRTAGSQNLCSQRPGVSKVLVEAF